MDLNVKARVKALNDLSSAEVVLLLHALEVSRYVQAFSQRNISGLDLPLLTDADLQGMGVSLGLHRRRLLLQLAKFHWEGVPLSHIGAGVQPSRDHSLSMPSLMPAAEQVVQQSLGGGQGRSNLSGWHA